MMSIAAFLSLISWMSFIALAWMMIFNYMDHGQGIPPSVGLIIFLLVAAISAIANSSTKGGDIDES